MVIESVDKVDQISGSIDVTWVTDKIDAYGDTSAIRVGFLGMVETDGLGVADLFPLVSRYAVEEDSSECVSDGYSLFVRALVAFAYTLTQEANLIVEREVPCTAEIFTSTCI